MRVLFLENCLNCLKIYDQIKFKFADGTFEVETFYKAPGVLVKMWLKNN